MSFIEQGSLKAFKRYRDMISLKGVKAKNHTDLEDGDTTSLEHLLWMCEHCIQRIPQGMSVDKYSRWMGYIQGVLVCKKLTTVENERNTTRPWLTPS